MKDRGWGITDLYGRYHDDSCDDPDVVELRGRHVGLERAVLDAYGWSDVSVDLGFHDARYGRFYTFAPKTRYELLIRLLELNIERVAEQTGQSREAVMREAERHV